MAAFENLLILSALFIIIVGLFRSKKEKFPPIVFILFALSFCVLIGLTAPNSGAIFRYRSPAMVFLLLAAVYLMNFKGSNFATSFFLTLRQVLRKQKIKNPD